MSTDDSYTFDVIFEDQSLGILFAQIDDADGAQVDGFYKDDHILEAEKSMKIALDDVIVAIQGRSVLGMDFRTILTRLQTRKRPMKVTFKRQKILGTTDISWNEVLSNIEESCIYLSFLWRKSCTLCAVWLSFLIEMERLTFLRGDERDERIKSIASQYVYKDGEYSSCILSSFPLPPEAIEKVNVMEYYLHNLKVELRDRVCNLTWNSFTLSPEYQFIRLNMKTVLFTRHFANIFLSFLISRDCYKELALWMALHYDLLPLIKNSAYPDSVMDAYNNCSINFMLDNEEETKEVILDEQTVSMQLEKNQAFAEAESLLTTKASIYLHSPIEMMTLQDSLHSTLSVDTEDESLCRRLSSSSTNIIDDPQDLSQCVAYSDGEMQSLIHVLVRVYKQYLQNRSFLILPEYYYQIIDEIIQDVNRGAYIDDGTIDILNNLFACIQIRLFHVILNKYYSQFVVTDLFEYLVNEIRYPKKDSISSSRLRKATQYSMSRLKNCEEEVAHLRKFIQDYSESTIQILDTTMPGDNDTTSEPIIEAALKRTSHRHSINNITTIEPITEKAKDVRSVVTTTFKEIDLLDIINYIHKHRSFSIHQPSPPSKVIDLHHLNNYLIFKALYYKGNEETQSVSLIDSVEIENIASTGLTPPGDPVNFFLPEGYKSYLRQPSNRVFTFLFGGTASERWSAACLNVYIPQTVNNSIVFVPEGIILLSPFNNLAALKERLISFLQTSYSEFQSGSAEVQHQLLSSFIKQTNRPERRRFSAAVFQHIDRLHHKHFFSDSDDDIFESPQPTSPSLHHHASTPLKSITSVSTPCKPRRPSESHFSSCHSTSGSDLISPKLNIIHPEHSSLSILFSLLSEEHIIELIRLLLLEYSVLFVSSQYSLLTTTMEALKELLRPFVWNYTYCPVLTKSMMNYINSPMPYIMGANIKCVNPKVLEKLERVTIVNIDEDHIALPPYLQDYFTIYPDILSYPTKHKISRNNDEYILPPLPVVPNINLYTELHIL